MSEVEWINADELFTALRQIDEDEFISRLEKAVYSRDTINVVAMMADVGGVE